MWKKFKKNVGTSLVVQWVRLHVPNAGGLGSIHGGGIKVPHTPTRPVLQLLSLCALEAMSHNKTQRSQNK